MIQRLAIVAGVVGLAALALWHPARPPIVQSVGASPQAAAPTPFASRRMPASYGDAGRLVVYVAGAVRRPGLYSLRDGDRYARAIAMAGGLAASADAGGVDLAQRASDGEEIYVPAAGESTVRARDSRRRSAGHPRRRRAHPPPGASIDVNRAGASELAGVPGIGRAIGQRIVELRLREGAFTSLDQLLDVAGMTQSRLERARPYLRQP